MIDHNNHGAMGYRTPNIDRIAREGIEFTDYYGQQSCTARARGLYHRPEPATHRVDQGGGAVFAEGANVVGLATTAAPLPAREPQALHVVWAPETARQYNLTVAPVGPDAAGAGGVDVTPLCNMPSPASFALSVRDLPLYEDWNLIGPPLRLYNDDVEVVQRGIEGNYTAILGYDGGLLACYGDDETTPEIDGARAGDALTLLVDGVPVDARPLAFNGEEVAVTLPVRWTAHGDRWRLHAGPPNRIILPIIGRAARVK